MDLVMEMDFVVHPPNSNHVMIHLDNTPMQSVACGKLHNVTSQMNHQVV